MRFGIDKFLLSFLMLFFCFGINAQEKTNLPIPLPANDEWECALTDTPLVELYISVSSNRKGDLKDLTRKNFVVDDEKEIRAIEFFKFDELKNQYIIGFFKDDNIPENKWRSVEIKLKLSKEKKKDYGKISVKAQKGYYQKSEI